MSFLPAPLFPRLIINLAEFITTLATPALWSQFANEEAFHLLVLIFQTAQALDIPYSDTKTYHIPSETVNAPMPESGTGSHDPNQAQNLTDQAFRAVIGADNFVDIEDHVTMKDVLDEMVDITRTVTPTCK